MTEPTKEQLNELADAYAATAKLHQDNSVASAVAYALRLAANLPSTGDVKNIIHTQVHVSMTGGKIIDIDAAAIRILERIRSVK